MKLLADFFPILLFFGAFHLYDIKEVFSNADGSVQFVELFTSFNNQQFLSGHTIVASQDASTNTFTFAGSGPSPTASTGTP